MTWPFYLDTAEGPIDLHPAAFMAALSDRQVFAGTPLASWVIRDTADLILAWGMLYELAKEAHPFHAIDGKRGFPSMSSATRRAELPLAAKAWQEGPGPRWAGGLYDQGSFEALKALLHPSVTIATLPCETWGMLGNFASLGSAVDTPPRAFGGTVHA